MKKRLISLLLLAALLMTAALGFAACTRGRTGEAQTAAPGAPETESAETPSCAEATPTPEPATEEPIGNAVIFVNSLSAELREICITASDVSNWGEPIAEGIAPGSETRLDFELFGEPGQRFDIGTMDVNLMNYDGYGIELNPGDRLELTSDGTNGVLTVTKADGTSSSYTLFVYPSDEISA